MEKKRVLIVVGSPLCNAGVPGVIMTLVRALSDQFVFDVLSLSKENGYYDQEFLGFGGKIYRMEVIDYKKHKILYPYRLVQIKKSLKALLKMVQYDAIHCHCGLDSGICLRVARKAGVRNRLAHAHGTYVRKGKNVILRIFNRYCKALIKKCSTVRLACSELAGKTLFPKSDYINVLNPIDVKYYQTVTRVAHEGIHLLQIGYFCENKNQLFSLKVANKLKELGLVVRLTFIGFVIQEDYFSQMKKYIKNNNLEDCVTFFPHDTSKKEAFSQADFSLLPSESEGLPLVALESQAAGVVCLMSKNVSCDADVGGAFFLEHNDLEKWVEQIKGEHGDLCKNPCSNLELISIETYTKRIGALYGQ